MTGFDLNDRILVFIILANFLFAMGYLVYGLFIQPKLKVLVRPSKIDEIMGDSFDDDDYRIASDDDVPELIIPEKQEDDLYKKERVKKRVIIITLIFIIFPVASEAVMGIGLFLKLFFNKPVDLNDVVFDKEKKRPMHRSDTDRERNLVPLEEALAVMDHDNLRSLMLNILKGEIDESLNSIMQALNSDDSETSHYAASVLSDELNDFRANVQNVYNYVKENAEKEADIRRRLAEGEEVEEEEEESYDHNWSMYASALIKYIALFLAQHVFTEMEEDSYGIIMNDVAEIMYSVDNSSITSIHYQWITDTLLNTDELELCEKWADRATVAFPDNMAGYTPRIKLYFKKNERRRFLDVLDDLEKSDVVIDANTLKLIRAFK